MSRPFADSWLEEATEALTDAIADHTAAVEASLDNIAGILDAGLARIAEALENAREDAPL